MCEETLTWDRIKAQYAYWRNNPPVHEAFARFIGIKLEHEQKYGDLSELLGLFPSGNISIEPQVTRIPT